MRHNKNAASLKKGETLRFFIKIKQFHTLLVSTVVFGLCASLALAAPGRRPTEPRRTVEQRGRHDRMQNKAELLELAQKLSVPEAQLVAFLKVETKTSKENKQAWSQLLTEIQKSQVARESVRSYIEMRNSRVIDDFHIRGTDLLAIQKNWTPVQKANFAKVLQRMAEISNTGRVLTAEQAFEQAMKENGFWEKYRSCKL